MFDCDRYHFLFSTTTRFARNIDNDYYGEKHYVWTALHFNQLQEEFNVRGQAASSDPMTIATRFIQDVATRDEHCDRIYAHISAVERGANEMLINNKIDEKTKKCVDARICTAVNTDFLPLVYVMPALT